MKPIIRKPTEAEINEAKQWPVWEKEASEFPWQYSQQETCLILEGDATVTSTDGEKFSFTAGDYVIFPKGMKCVWKINKDIRKHYRFS